MSLACLIFILILNMNHYILFAGKICILLLLLHGLDYEHARYPHFSAILRYCIPGGIPLQITLLCTSRFF